MRRIGLIVAGVCLVLVLAVVGAVLAVPAFVDKGFVEQQAKAATGRDLTIGGDFNLDLITGTPSVAMENVAFANASWGSRPEMAKLRRFSAEVELIPLLSGNLEVNRFHLEGLDLIAERGPDGRANWEFAPAGGGETQQQPAEGKEERSEPGEVTVPLVKDLVVRDVNVLFRDRQANQEMTARVDALELKAPDAVSPMKLTMRGTFNKIPFEADGTLGSINQLTGKEKPYPLTIVAKALGAVFDAKGEIGDLQDVSGLNVRVSLAGDKLETTVNAAKPLVPQLAQATVPELGPYKLAALIQGSPEELKISDIDVSIGKPDQLLVTAAGEVGNALQAKKLNVKFALKAPNVAPIARALKLDIPPVPPLEVSGVARDPDGWMAIENLAVKAADSDLAGRIAVKQDSDRPVLAADLTSNLLNLDKLLPQQPGQQQPAAKPAAAPQPQPEGGQQRVFPDDPLPFGELKNADADIKFKGQKIIHNGLPIEGVVVEARLADGKLAVKPLQAKVFDGTIAAEASVDGAAAVPSLASKLDIVQLDYGKVLDAVGQKGLARGKVDLKTDITSKGGSVRAIMAGLNGFTHVTTKDGMMDNRLVQLVTADIQNIAPMFSRDEHKEIKCGVIRFGYKDGLANADTFLFETGGLAVIGTGSINLAQETLNLAFDPKAKNKSAVQLAIPFTVGGTLASPSPGVAAEQVAKKAGKVVLGVMTGGMSTLAEAAYDAVAPVDQTDYCALALAGKPLTADPSKVTETKSESKPAAAPSGQPSPAKPAEGLGGAVEGAGKALQGLFGR